MEFIYITYLYMYTNTYVYICIERERCMVVRSARFGIFDRADVGRFGDQHVNPA